MIRPEFTVRRFRHGYRRDQVDGLVDRVLGTITHRRDAQPITRTELRSIAFDTTSFPQLGYSMDEVDAFIDRAEGWLPREPKPDAQPGPDGQPQPRLYARPRFTVSRFREGYEMLEVDEFVDRVMATVERRSTSKPVTVHDIRNTRFTPVRLREGYDIVEVDEFLEQAEGWLDGR